MTLLVHRAPVLLSVIFDAQPPTEIYSLSLHDALPISGAHALLARYAEISPWNAALELIAEEAPEHVIHSGRNFGIRSEEHTSELQSHSDLVCRLLLEKKKSARADLTHVVCDQRGGQTP